MEPEEQQVVSLSVGELAGRTGLTVRALHHYDELGLLVPRERTQAGHRRYGAGDVERVYRIVALRRLGLGLDAVAGVLDGDGGRLEAVVRAQLAALDARQALDRRLRALLDGVLGTLERSERPSVDDVLKTIEVTEMMEKYYTPEQLDKLARRKEEMGEEAIRGVEQEWEGIFARLREERAAGTDPADPSLDPLRTRMSELIAMFHGGDQEIYESMSKVWANEDPAELTGGGLDAELASYMGQVQAARGRG